MPFPSYAIPGQPDLGRKRQKAKRLAQEDIANLPNWSKNWTPEQMETYVDDALDDLTSLASAKAILKDVLPKMAWMCGALRDYMLLKQEEDQ